MPRPPNPQAKIVQVIVRAKDETEKLKIQAFKEICARNGIKMNQELMTAIDHFLIKHNWPPGNSQTLLQTFIGETKKKCYFCKGMFPTLTKVEFISGLIAPVCKECLDEARNKKGTVKKVLGPV